MANQFCIKGTYNITKHKGECPMECPYGHWNNHGTTMPYGVGCGAECLKSGGTLFVIADDKIFCDGCNEIEQFDW